MWACMCHMKPDLLDTHPLLPSSSNTHIANSKTSRPLLNVEIYDDLEAKQETRFFKRGSCLVLKKFRFRNHYMRHMLPHTRPATQVSMVQVNITKLQNESNRRVYAKPYQK